MNATLSAKENKEGFSIITCTNRPKYINNLFKNYDRQIYKKKELILILNNDCMNMKKYIEKAKKYRNVHIFQLPEETSLGNCLNFGVDKSTYSHVAKFDDDDYYAPSYLTEYMQVFKKTGSDVVGKRAHYLWLKGKRVLILRYPRFENIFVNVLPGATLAIKKTVFQKVRFANQSTSEDYKFCKDSRRLGFKIYSAGKENFIAIRRKNSKDHTWIISDNRLLAHNSQKIPEVEKYKKFVTSKKML